MGEKVSGNASNEKYKMTIKLFKDLQSHILELTKKIRSNVIISCFSVQAFDIDHNKRPLAQNTKTSLMVIASTFVRIKQERLFKR